MATLAVQLTEAQASRLLEEAGRLGVPPEELARAAVVDLVTHRSDDSARLVEELLEKNAELYKRLA